MSHPQVQILHGVAQLQAAAAAWDDLWWRSAVTRPTVRAELLAQWLEHFAPQADFCALVVEDQGQWVAALPLVRIAGCGRFGAVGIPSNEWSTSGDLLLANSQAVDGVLDALVAAMGKLPYPLLWLDDVPLESRRWTALLAALDRAAVAHDREGRWRIGRIEVGDDWQQCKTRWSKNHRRKMAKAAQRLASLGDVKFEMHSGLSPEQAESLLTEGLEVEDRGWKGEAGTSVLRTPGMSAFFLRQARQLAQWNQLELALLRCDGQAVALVYGLRAKGVCHWHKIGYDPQYASCTPGQLLQCCILEQLHAQPEIRAVDCMGPINHALSRWKPVEYTTGRVIVAPRPGLGRAALYACKHLWPRVRCLTGRSPSAMPDQDNEDSLSPATHGGHQSNSPAS